MNFLMDFAEWFSEKLFDLDRDLMDSRLGYALIAKMNDFGEWVDEWMNG